MIFGKVRLPPVLARVKRAKDNTHRAWCLIPARLKQWETWKDLKSKNLELQPITALYRSESGGTLVPRACKQLAL